MKQLSNTVKLAIWGLFFIGIITLCFFIYDSKFPFLKFSLLFSKIISYSFLILSLISMLVLFKSTKLKSFHYFSYNKKIAYSIIWLFFSTCFLVSIGFISYLTNKDCFNIDKEYTTTIINKRVNDINSHINSFNTYIIKYKSLYNNININQNLICQNIDNILFITVGKDTIFINLDYQLRLGGGTGAIINESSRSERLLNGASKVNILLKNEIYDNSYPTNYSILKSIKDSNIVKGRDLYYLIAEKIKFYKDRSEKFIKTLNEQQNITFGDFIEYNIFNTSITGNKTNIFIRILVLFQAIVITFISGYIYQLLYKILDGVKKPEL